MALFSSRAFICLANSLSTSVFDFQDDYFKMTSGSGHGVASKMLVTPWLSSELIREDFRRVLSLLKSRSSKSSLVCVPMDRVDIASRMVELRADLLEIL